MKRETREIRKWDSLKKIFYLFRNYEVKDVKTTSSPIKSTE